MSYYLSGPKTSEASVQHRSVLSNHDITEVLRYIATQTTSDGLLADGKTNSEIRRSKVFFIPMGADTSWLYDKIGRFIADSNQKHFGFDITALQNIQYTEYHEKDSGTYGDHLDWAPRTITARKLSMSIQLTEGTDYKGGDLHLKFNSLDPKIASREKGDGILFPSWILHGVTPVTQGTRKSLVIWVEGPEWK